jgi:hypothetical protein
MVKVYEIIEESIKKTCSPLFFPLHERERARVVNVNNGVVYT